MKPAIGLNGWLRVNETDASQQLTLGRDYTDSVLRAGGLPLVLPVTTDPDTVDDQLDLVDGLVLTGGEDLDPKLYGEPRHPKTELMHPDRQFHDIELARAALRRKMPILAICAGIQLVNVLCGGSLVQHVPEFAGGAVPHEGEPGKPVHDVLIEPGTALAAIVGPDPLPVNSTHHQAVKRVGAGLIVSARSRDGLVEALETEADTFLVCVQWHPERLAVKGDERHLALFEALVKAAHEEPEAA